MTGRKMRMVKKQLHRKKKKIRAEGNRQTALETKMKDGGEK